MKKTYVLLFAISFSLEIHAQWMERNNGLSNTQVNTMATNGTELFAGTENGVFLSTDDGGNWNNLSQGLYQAGYGHGVIPLPPIRITALALSGSNLYAGPGDGYYAYMTTDNGVNWMRALNLYQASSSLIAAKGNSVYECNSFGQVYRTGDNGITWTILNVNGPYSYTFIRCLAVYNDNLYGVGSHGEVYVSVNDTSLTKVDTGLATLLKNNLGLAQDFINIRQITLSVAESGSNLFAACYVEYNIGSDNLVYIGRGVFISTNYGSDWVKIDDGQLPSKSVKSVAIINNNLFVGGENGIWSRPLSDYNPSISSISPLTGSLGTIVTIQGHNFDPIAANDIVKFNGVIANVTTCTDTTITAIVPLNASSGAVSVTAYDRTVLSSQSFTIIKLDQSIVFDAINDVTLGDSPIKLNATATSNLPIEYTTSSDKITINASDVGFVKAGRAYITAQQTGNNSFNAAVPVIQSFCIKPAIPIISLTIVNNGLIMLTSSSNEGNQWYKDDVPIPDAVNASLLVNFSGAYKVQVKIDDCVSEFSSKQIISITEDITTQSEEVALYPNPVETFLWLKGLGGEIKRAEVFDVNCNIIPIFFEKEDDVFKVNVRNLSQGLYFLRVENIRSAYTIRFVKK